MKHLGFIGVGKMGRGMCENLIKQGHGLTIYDKLAENCAYFEGKATVAADAQAVFEASEIIFLSLPNSAVIEQVVAGFLAVGVAGKTVIDVSTSDPESTVCLYEQFKAAGGVFLDAPLLGGPDDTMAGNAPCIIAGDEAEVERVKPIIAAYADPIDYFGKIGSAHTVKLAMNFTGLMYAALSAQMFPLMEKMGINTKNLFEVMNNGPFGNWVFNFYGQKFVNKDYHMDFALELALKDMTYMKRMYDKFNAPAFLLDGGLDLMRAAVKDGRGSHDTSEMAATMYEYLGLPTGEEK